jgi:hypothetical protein
METILRKYTHLTNEQFGHITKLILDYIAGKEVTDTSNMGLFFDRYIRRELDQMLKARKRTAERRKKNAN